MESDLSYWMDCSTEDSIDISAANTILFIGNQAVMNGNNYLRYQRPSAPSNPQTGTRTLNSLNVCDFDGTDDLIQVNGSNEPVSTSHVGVMAVNVDAVNNTTDAIFSMNATNDYQIDSNSTTEFLLQMNGTGWTDDEYGTDISGAWHIISWELDSTANTVTAWLDGTSVVSITDYNTDIDTAQEIKIFANRGSSVNPDGAVADFVMFDSADTDKRQKAEGYMAHRYGLEGNLPAGHPYKSSAP